jgi:hypothetical protein
MEQWKPIGGWDGYEVSSSGRIRSFKFCRQRPNEALPRILAGYSLPTGYHMIDLKDRGKHLKTYTHHLVAAAFIGPRPAGHEVAHCNGDNTDNRADNLRYATPLENNFDKVAHGTNVGGADHYAARLTTEQARAVYLFPGSHREAADAFGVPYHLAYNLRTGRTYRDATEGL